MNGIILFIVAIFAIFQAENAQEATPDGCFLRFCDKILECATPFQRSSGVSEAQCIDSCKQTPQCQSATYRFQQNECALFPMVASPTIQRGGRRKRNNWYPPRQNNNCGYMGPRLMHCPAVNYYQRTGSYCGSTTTTSTTTTTTTRTTTTTVPLPDGAVCPAGQVARYLRLDGAQLAGNTGSTFTATSLQQCIDACTNNQLPTGQQAACVSFDFNQATMLCTPTSQALSPKGTGTPQPNPQSAHFEKICVNASLVAGCATVFPFIPQKILAGFAQNVIKVNSIQECLQACLDASTRFGFKCKSGMFYYSENDLNCILNSDDRTTHPDLFIDETNDQVTYFETGCQGQGGGTGTQASPLASPSLLGTNKPEWGAWTTCGADGNRFRYRNCKNPNPNSCERGQAACIQKRADITTPCNALIKPDGTKDCSRLSRHYQLGQLEECEPIDCP